MKPFRSVGALALASLFACAAQAQTACTQLSLAPCSTVPVALPYALDFNAPAGGLGNSGFTMVLPHSVSRYPATPSIPELRSFEPSLVARGGRLVVTATRGSFQQTQAESVVNNTQVNALGVAVPRRPEPFRIDVDLTVPDLPDTANGESGGLYYGADEDYFVRLSVTNRAGAGNAIVELRREINGVSTAAATDTRTANIEGATGATVHLTLILDPATNTASGRYVLGAQTGSLGPLSLPSSFFAQRTLPDGVTNYAAFAGIHTTNRFNAGVAYAWGFDDWTLAEYVNAAPIAEPDAIAVLPSGTATTLVGGATSVLANDTDPEGEPLSAALVTGPTHGTLTLNANGTFSYTHNGDTARTDAFTYRAYDGVVSSTPATVSIEIIRNDPPTAVADAYTTSEGATLVVPPAQGVLANDTDPENDTLAANLVSNPAHGTLTLAANGGFTYVHDGGAATSDTFTYAAGDGELTSAPATVTIAITPIDEAPAASDDALTVAEGGLLTLAAPGVLANDVEPDGTALSAVLAIAPQRASMFQLGADGSVTYRHDGSETTSDAFAYRASDGTLVSSTAVASITIAPVNDAPAIAALDRLARTGDVVVIDLRAAVSDADGSTATLTLAGDLPPGFARDGDVLSGTVTDAARGVWIVLLTANDGAGGVTTRAFRLVFEGADGVMFRDGFE